LGRAQGVGLGCQPPPCLRKPLPFVFMRVVYSRHLTACRGFVAVALCQSFKPDSIKIRHVRTQMLRLSAVLIWIKGAALMWPMSYAGAK
jgi:hypothetical protein